MNKKTQLIQWMGITGILSLLSYTMAVLIAPLAYPNYNWLTQAVSDLSAVDSPALLVWNQINSLYVPCGVVSIMMVILFIQNKLNRWIRMGIYLFAVMVWVSGIGYAIFPLSTGGYAGTFMDIIHVYVVTVLVVITSFGSFILMMIGGFKQNAYKSLAISASIALGLMMVGAIGIGMFFDFFGLFERFNVFAAVGFNALLGIYLIKGFKGYQLVQN